MKVLTSQEGGVHIIRSRFLETPTAKGEEVFENTRHPYSACSWDCTEMHHWGGGLGEAWRYSLGWSLSSGPVVFPEIQKCELQGWPEVFPASVKSPSFLVGEPSQVTHYPQGQKVHLLS